MAERREMKKKKARDHIRVAEHKCPKCDYPMDCISAAFTKNTPTPRPGDFTICLCCGAMLTFTDSKGGIRLPTIEEKDIMNKRYDITMLRLAQATIVGDKIKEQLERGSGNGSPQ
jgi:hypothetical protein